MKRTTTCAALACALATLAASPAAVIHFDDLPLDEEGYWSGSGADFTIDVVTFSNYHDFGLWLGGFSYTNHTDTLTAGPGNQYSAIAGGGAGGSPNYAVVQDPGSFGPPVTITFSDPVNLQNLGAMIVNTTYAALSMRNGDDFAKKFGGESGNDEDWFLLTITGYLDNTPTGKTVEFYLADFQSSDNGMDYIVDEWTFVDFSPLEVADQLRFSLSSSDGDPDSGWMNTPAYFAMDHFLVPEPSVALTALAGLSLFLRRRRS